MNQQDRDEYGFTSGDIVHHIKDNSAIGLIKSIDRNLPHPTTCCVVWGDDPQAEDIIWTNKLTRILS